MLIILNLYLRAVHLLQMTRIFLNGMIERKCGRIITICSIASLLTAPTMAVYCATKMGLKGFMQCLFEELLVNNYQKFVKLTSVYPDFINTRKEVTETLDQFEHFLPRLTPEEVADAAVNASLKKRQHVIVSKIKLAFKLIR